MKTNIKTYAVSPEPCVVSEQACSPRNAIVWVKFSDHLDEVQALQEKLDKALADVKSISTEQRA